MRNAWRKALLLCMLLAIVFCVVTAAAQDRRVFDSANLFSTEQESELEVAITALRASTGMDVVIATTEDAQGKSAMAYADDFYDENGFGTGSEKSGVLFLIDMDNREAYISTSGDMIDILTDSRIQSIIDSAYAGLKSEDYAAAASAFISGVTRYYSEGVPSGQVRYDTDAEAAAQPRTLTAGEIAIFFLIAAVVGLIACWIVVSSYRMRTPTYSYPVADKGTLNLGRCEDLFINQTITRHRIQSSNSSGGAGGSSTHRSSSGRSHGGGGRKF